MAAFVRMGFTAALYAVFLWTSGSVVASAQATPSPGTPNPPRFEVATVKRNVSGAAGLSTVFQPSGYYRAFNVRLRDLVSEAYRVRGFQVVGGPPWVATDRFDIEAKAEDPAMLALIAKPDGTRAPSESPFLMLRELLKDRFKLTVHSEIREGPAYALLLARTARGPGLRPPAVNCAAIDPRNPPPGVGLCGGIAPAAGRFTARAATMAQLARSLSILLQRLVIDRTGVSEPFDFDLEWTPIDSNVADAATPVVEFAPSLLAALDEQLGVKLDAQRAPIEYIVIDNAAPPSDN